MYGHRVDLSRVSCEQLLFRLLSMLVFGVFHFRITVFPKIEDARIPQNGKFNNKEIKIAHYIYGVPYFQTPICLAICQKQSVLKIGEVARLLR